MYDIFYFGIMMFLVMGNCIQIGKGFGNPISNWLQIIVYGGTLVAYFLARIGDGVDGNFFFLTTMAFVLALCLEVFQTTIMRSDPQKKKHASFFGYVMVFVSFVVVFSSVAIVTEVI